MDDERQTLPAVSRLLLEVELQGHLSSQTAPSQDDPPLSPSQIVFHFHRTKCIRLFFYGFVSMVLKGLPINFRVFSCASSELDFMLDL